MVCRDFSDPLREAPHGLTGQAYILETQALQGSLPAYSRGQKLPVCEQATQQIGQGFSNQADLGHSHEGL